jgi:MFS family permease
MNRRKLAAFLAASFFYWISQYIFVPTLPEYVRLRTTSLAAVGIVLSMYGLWQAIVRIPLGVSVDKTGRGKTFLILGFLIGATGTMILAFGRSQGILTFGRALNGIAAGTWVPLIVVFSALFPPKEAVVATSLLTFSGSLGRMIATTMTGFLNNLGGYGLAFSIGAATAVVSVVIIALTKIEKQDTHEVSAVSIRRIFTRGDVLIPAIIAMVAQFDNWAVTFGFMPILAAQIGANDVVQSLLVGMNILALTIGNLLNTPVARRLSRTNLLYASFSLFIAGTVLFAVTRNLPLFFLATVMMGLANGFSYPTLMGLSIERVDQPHRTTAMGIHQSVYALGMFAGPWIGGILSDIFGIRWTFAVIALFCLVTAYPLIYLRRRVVTRSLSK